MQKNKTVLKRIKAIFLVIVLVFPFWGFYFFLNHEIHQTRKQVKRYIISGLDKEQLCKLTFSINGVNNLIKWKHNKEFEYKNVMYDIVFKETHNDSISYWCWKDNEETKLRYSLDKLVARTMNDNDSKSSQSQRINDFLKILYYYSFSNSKNEINGILKFNYPELSDNYISVVLNPHSPPPKAS